MRFIKYFLILITLSPSYGQITGKIIDAVTEVPIDMASIISESDTTFSDSRGLFKIGSSAFITVEANGYQVLWLKADTVKTLLIRIQPLIYDLSEVNIIAYHTPGKLRSVAGAVSVVPLSAIQAADYNIASSLSTSPGVFIQEATPGTMKLTLRGIGSRYPYGTKKIKMYFDDIPLYSAEGETYFDELNPEYLSRMEILRGPASGIYGASLGGTVMLYPKRPQYGSKEIYLSGSAGSFGYRKTSLGFSGGISANDLVLSISRVQTEGYRENSKYERNSFMLNFNHNISPEISGTLLLSGSLVQAQIPSSVDSLAFYTNPRGAAPVWLQTKGNKSPQRLLAGYKLKYSPSMKWDFSGSVFSTYRENEENRPFNFLNESGVSFGGRFLALYSQITGQIAYKFTGGSNLFFESYKSSISENPGGKGIKGGLQQKGSQLIYQSDIFSQMEIIFSNITVSGGFDLNNSGFSYDDLFSSDTLDQSGEYNFKPVFSPRLSLSWNPFKDVIFYAALNHGFTIPSLSETQTPLGLINRDIKHEKAWSYESGLRFDLFNDATNIDLAFFYMKVSDLIVPKRIEEDFYVGMNAGASLHRGIELAVRQRLWGIQNNLEDAPFSAFLNLSYSLNKFNFLDFTENENDFSGNQLPGMPENYLSGNLEFKTSGGIYSELGILSSGRIPLDDFNSRYTKSWTILNARAGYTFRLTDSWEFDALINVMNITNKHYSSMVVVNAPGTAARPPRYYYPGMPRWVSFNVGVKYIID